MDGTIPATYLTNTGYRQKYYRLTIVDPVFLPDPTSMLLEQYYIDDPLQGTGPKPVYPFKIQFNPVVPTPPASWTASLVISYDLYDLATDSRPSWIKSYD